MLPRFSKRPSPAMVVALFALVFALAGSAFGAASMVFNSDRVDGFHASAKPKARTLLALNKKAKVPASALTVKRGPAGPQGAKGDPGPKGDAGPQGPTGDTGPSNLYSSYVESRTHNSPWTSHWDWDDLATVSAPNGSYLVLANAVISNGTPDAIRLFCMLAPGGPWEGGDYVADSAYLDLPAGATEPVSLSGPGDLPAPNVQWASKFLCRVDSQPLPVSGSVTYKDIDLMALKVGDWQPQ